MFCKFNKNHKIFVIVYYVMQVFFLVYHHNSHKFAYASDNCIIPSIEEFRETNERALNGDPDSQLYMGIFFANGNHVVQNYAEAAKWYKLAAINGNSTAQRNLALLYDCGLGVERNYVEAIKWYKTAGKMGEPAALMGLARFAFTYSESLLSPAYGSYNEFRLLAFYLMDVDLSVKNIENDFWEKYYTSNKYWQNDTLIVDHVMQLAKNGDHEAQLRVAIFYFQGQGVLRSSNDFIKWLRDASKNNTHALFMLNKKYYCPSTYPMYEPIENDCSYFMKQTPEAMEKKRELYFARKSALKQAAESNKEEYFKFWYSYTYEYKTNKPFPKSIYQMAKTGYRFALNLLYHYITEANSTFISPCELYQIAYNGALKGDLYSMVIVSHCRLIGFGCKKSVHEAIKWMQMVGDSRDIRGMLQLGKMLAGKNIFQAVPEDTIRSVIKNANEDSKIQAILGIYYYNTNETENAVYWLKKSTAQNNFTAMLLTQILYPNRNDLHIINNINHSDEDYSDFKQYFTALRYFTQATQTSNNSRLLHAIVSYGPIGDIAIDFDSTLESVLIMPVLIGIHSQSPIDSKLIPNAYSHGIFPQTPRYNESIDNVLSER